MIGNVVAGLFGIPTPPSVAVDYLVIAGGGGVSGSTENGGGGAGGYRTSVGTTGGGGSAESSLSLMPNVAYAITIGAGGSGASNGTDSIFDTITSTRGVS